MSSRYPSREQLMDDAVATTGLDAPSRRTTDTVFALMLPT